MLEHQKIILASISDNKLLFKKELMKSTNWLNPEELLELYQWVVKHYQKSHSVEIAQVFAYA